MSRSFQISIHALRRSRTEASTFVGGLALLLLPVVVYWYASVEAMDHRHWLVNIIGICAILSMLIIPLVIAVLLLIKIARCYIDYMWAKSNGLYIGTTRDYYWYHLLPVQLVTVLLVLGLGFAFRVHPFFVGFILIAMAVLWFLIYESGSRGSALLAAQLSDFSYAYLSKPSYFMHSMGLSGSRVPKSSFFRRVLVVPCASDGLFLQGLAAHRDVTQIRFLRSWGVVKLVLDELSWRRAGNANQEGPVDASEGVFSIHAVIERWPERELLRWHGVLSDGTIIVRNEGVLHLIPPGFEEFGTYAEMLTRFGYMMGVSEYHVLIGEHVISKACAPSGSSSLG